MNIQPKTRSDSTGHKGSKRTSPSHQIYLLSGHAKRVATALRNVFKSDAKEESSKSKEQVPSHAKYLSVDPMRTSFETVSVENSQQGLLFVCCSRSGGWSFKNYRLHEFFCQILGLAVVFWLCASGIPNFWQSCPWTLIFGKAERVWKSRFVCLFL